MTWLAGDDPIEHGYDGVSPSAADRPVLGMAVIQEFVPLAQSQNAVTKENGIVGSDRQLFEDALLDVRAAPAGLLRSKYRRHFLA